MLLNILQKSVEIKGFRKGKTPLATIRSLYGDKIKDDVAQNLVQNFYFKALKEHDVIPVGMPDIDFKKPEENQEFRFSAKFEVQPEITLAKTEGLSVQKEKIAITDEQLENNIETILENQSKMDDVVLIRDLKDGDFADIDFKGFIDGQALDNGEAKGHILEIGSNSFIPGFEEALIGMKPGEQKRIPLKFPEDYHVEDLKGKAVDFNVTLNKIKEKIKPETQRRFCQGTGGAQQC